MYYIAYEEGVSNCCGAMVLENTERCEDCQENCKVISEDDLGYEEGVSNCCGARVVEHSERCDACQENCQVVEE
tara:strand:+ start:157 stop:378 length:222 start_codon:yes stop_codon:yes gene_type:complete